MERKRRIKLKKGSDGEQCAVDGAVCAALCAGKGAGIGAVRANGCGAVGAVSRSAVSAEISAVSRRAKRGGAVGAVSRSTVRAAICAAKAAAFGAKGEGNGASGTSSSEVFSLSPIRRFPN